jgi:hypothetical protein
MEEDRDMLRRFFSSASVFLLHAWLVCVVIALAPSPGYCWPCEEPGIYFNPEPPAEIYVEVLTPLQLEYTAVDTDWDGESMEPDCIFIPDTTTVSFWTGHGSQRWTNGSQFTTLGDDDVFIRADDTGITYKDGCVVQRIIVHVRDTTPPTAGNATSPPYVSSGSITVSYTGASDNYALDHVELWYKKGTTGDWTNSALTQQGSAGSFPSFTPGEGEGVYYFDLVAKDTSGNSSAAASGQGDCHTIYKSLGICQFSSLFLLP